MTAERANHTPQATDMVNDASLQVVDARQARWQERKAGRDRDAATQA